MTIKNQWTTHSVQFGCKCSTVFCTPSSSNNQSNYLSDHRYKTFLIKATIGKFTFSVCKTSEDPLCRVCWRWLCGLYTCVRDLGSWYLCFGLAAALNNDQKITLLSFLSAVPDSRATQLPDKMTASHGITMLSLSVSWITEPGTRSSDIMMRLSWPGPSTVISQLKSDIWCNRRLCYVKGTVNTKLSIEMILHHLIF